MFYVPLNFRWRSGIARKSGKFVIEWFDNPRGSIQRAIHNTWWRGSCLWHTQVFSSFCLSFYSCILHTVPHFDIASISRYGEPDPCLQREYDMKVSLQMASVQYVHTQRFQAEVVAFIQHFTQLQDVLGRQRAAAEGQAVRTHFNSVCSVVNFRQNKLKCWDSIILFGPSFCLLCST